MGFWFKLRSGTTLAPVGPGGWSGKGGERICRSKELATERNLSQTQTSLGEGVRRRSTQSSRHFRFLVKKVDLKFPRGSFRNICLKWVGVAQNAWARFMPIATD